jgi:dolichol-phosphate mannosyltransferase
MDKTETEKKQFKEQSMNKVASREILSLVVPTFNERDNIESLIENIASLRENNMLPLELIIVDDDSPDGTGQAAIAMSKRLPMKVVTRRWRRGLSSAVLEGFEVAEGDILGIMDGDLSHDFRIIPEMEKTIRKDGFDIALGSRYIPGGGMDKSWPFKRRFLSFIGTQFAKRLIPVKDPLSGFMLFRKDILSRVKLNTYGFKIGLEILVRTGSLNIKEIPFIFINREKGVSKIGIRTMLDYFIQLCDLFIYKYKREQKISHEIKE